MKHLFLALAVLTTLACGKFESSKPSDSGREGFVGTFDLASLQSMNWIEPRIRQYWDEFVVDKDHAALCAKIYVEEPDSPTGHAWNPGSIKRFTAENFFESCGWGNLANPDNCQSLAILNTDRTFSVNNDTWDVESARLTKQNKQTISIKGRAIHEGKVKSFGYSLAAILPEDLALLNAEFLKCWNE